MTHIKRQSGTIFWIIIAIGVAAGLSPFLLAMAQQAQSELLITEVSADNETTLADEDGDYADWVEIYNRTSQPLNLSGFALTDDPDQPKKWVFPDMTLGNGEYLLIFASGKNRTDPGHTLHTNFKLNRQGEFLGLYSLFDDRFVDQIGPEVAPHLADVSYGRYADLLRVGYLANPTPGQVNDESQVWFGLVAAVTATVERGFYDQPFTVELTTSTPQATIIYTTDGSQPDEENGTVYTEPLSIDQTTLLRAAAVKPGFLPAPPTTHSYIFWADVLSQPTDPPGFPTTWGVYPKDAGVHKEGEPALADYEMDPTVVNDPRYRESLLDGLRSIPAISLVMDPASFNELYSNPRERGRAWERPVSVELIAPESAANFQENIQINAGVRIQGGTGRWEFMPKHSFRLFFRGAYGPTKLNYPLFPDSPVEAFDTITLRAGTNRSFAARPETMLPYEATTYTRDEWLRASQIEMSGSGSHGIFVHLYVNGLYWGLYNAVERPDENFMAAYFGGEPEAWYAVNSDGPVSGSDERVAELMYLLARNDGLEAMIADPGNYELIQTYLDIPHMIDNFILNWYAGNRDWPHKNWYAGVRQPDGLIRYFVWDGEWIWIDGAEIYLGKNYKQNVLKVLFETFIKHPDFRMTLADRMYKHLFNDGALTDAAAQARWRRLNERIDPAIVAESARWGDVRVEPPLTRDDWLQAGDDVLAQMAGNAAQLIALARQSGYYPPLDPPVFNQQGGLVTPDFALTLTLPDNLPEPAPTIYYTLDGTDPRQAQSGAVHPQAIAYDGTPLLLTRTTHIKSRLFVDNGESGPTWSALNEATFRLVERDARLRMSEVMYNPRGGDGYEFIELKNVGNSSVEIANAFFEGIDFAFPPNQPPLAPGAVLVLARNPERFAARYPSVPLDGVYSGQLSNRGETLTLRDAFGEVLFSVTYDDENGWPISPDGRGDSLILVDPTRDPDDPRHWRASDSLNGTPGE